MSYRQSDPQLLLILLQILFQAKYAGILTDIFSKHDFWSCF